MQCFYDKYIHLLCGYFPMIHFFMIYDLFIISKKKQLKNCVPYKTFVIAEITCTNKKCHIHPVYIYSSDEFSPQLSNKMKNEI